MAKKGNRSAATRRRRTTLAAATLAALALALLLPTAALGRSKRAAASAGACPGQTLSQPFLRWLDPDSYTLAGDGGFEGGGAGWALRGGATVVSGNEPWHVHGARDSRSLYLPAGASAVSPPTCVGLLHPTARLFARSLGGSIRVDATVSLPGLSVRLMVGAVLPGSGFAPTLPMPILANLTAPLSGSTAALTLTFTAMGGGAQIDDVYVDPFKVN